MKTRIHRGQFLRNTGLGGAGLMILKSARSAGTAEANERLNVALVGVGGRGEWFVATIPKLENVATPFDSPFEFDPIDMKMVNNSAADALLRSDYRQGWSFESHQAFPRL